MAASATQEGQNVFSSSGRPLLMNTIPEVCGAWLENDGDEAEKQLDRGFTFDNLNEYRDRGDNDFGIFDGTCSRKQVL